MPQLAYPGKMMWPRGSSDNYVFGGQSAELVADHSGKRNNGVPYYRKQGSTTTFNALFGTRYDRSDMATMFDSSGNLVWNAHNLVDTPDAPVTQDVTVVSGAQYTVKMLGAGSVALSNAGSGTATDGSGVTFTAASTTLTLTVSGSVDDMWAYRSDLGGMATVPVDARGNASESDYVSGGPRFLSRRENYRYNGSSWVLAGLLAEPASTNSCLDSRGFSTGNWFDVGLTSSPTADQTGIDGQANTAYTVTDDDAAAVDGVRQTITVANDSNPTCASIFFEKTTSAASFPSFRLQFFGGTGLIYECCVNTDDGTLTRTSVADAEDDFFLEDADTFWRVSIVGSNNSTGNTSCRVLVQPAINTDGSSTISAATTGSCVIDQCDIVVGASVPSSPIITGSAAVIRATDVTAGQVLAADVPSDTTAVFYVMHGRVSYADNAATTEVDFYERRADADNAILARLDTSGANTGVIQGEQEAATVVDTADGNSELTPGVDVPFKFAVRYTSGAIQVANDGVAGTENSTPTALADLSAADLDLCGAFTGNVEMFLVGTGDPGEAGIEEASA